MIESHSLLSYYWFVRVKEWKVNNQTRWVVEGRVDGKRKRLQFDTKKQAETWLKAEKKDINSSACSLSQVRLSALLVAATQNMTVEVRSAPMSNDLMSMEFIRRQTYES